ncbi:hypothetical protein BSK59_28465 [Paenibacillus odorifer]|uniref:hypothetical protein n=1 Tax=Paenibacillus odorifer TaxID=189426 RepID=UPI00096FAD7E|nr:hypothetical protein [Paenibacillus odorifer]OME46943.1 hypothetical protein BSK59_28465 [Paenibacillus odorifer]
MNKIEENYKLLVSYIKHKWNSISTELDSILDVMPDEFEIDIKSRTVLNTYFKPETETELKEFEGYFSSFGELLNRTLMEDYSNTYSFIESSTQLIIKEMNKELEYKRYKKLNQKFSNKSEFYKMIKFIDGNIYKFNESDHLTIGLIEKYIRKIRNDGVHKPYESIGNEIKNAILIDNNNVDQRLRAVHSLFVDNINSLYGVVEDYKSILLKIVPDKG